MIIITELEESISITRNKTCLIRIQNFKDKRQDDTNPNTPLITKLIILLFF